MNSVTFIGTKCGDPYLNVGLVPGKQQMRHSNMCIFCEEFGFLVEIHTDVLIGKKLRRFLFEFGRDIHRYHILLHPWCPEPRKL